MAENVHNGATWIDHEEPPNTPWLVSQGIDDLKAAFSGAFVHLIDV